LKLLVYFCRLLQCPCLLLLLQVLLLLNLLVLQPFDVVLAHAQTQPEQQIEGCHESLLKI
jgi:hypothetical protein